MEKSIGKLVRDALTPCEPPQLSVRVDSLPNGAHLHVTKPDGTFVGMLSYTVVDNSESLDFLAASLHNWIDTLRNAHRVANA